MTHERVGAQCGFAEAGQVPELKKPLAIYNRPPAGLTIDVVCGYCHRRSNLGCGYVSINHTRAGR